MALQLPKIARVVINPLKVCGASLVAYPSSTVSLTHRKLYQLLVIGWHEFCHIAVVCFRSSSFAIRRVAFGAPPPYSFNPMGYCFLMNELVLTLNADRPYSLAVRSSRCLLIPTLAVLVRLKVDTHLPSLLQVSMTFSLLLTRAPRSGNHLSHISRL